MATNSLETEPTDSRIEIVGRGSLEVVDDFGNTGLGAVHLEVATDEELASHLAELLNVTIPTIC